MLFALPRLALCASAVLFNGVLVWANTHTVLDPGFSQCKDCFFRGTPPPALSEVGLEQRCHKQLTGRPFASLFNAGCQTTVYTALHLSLDNGWGRGGQDKQDSKEQIDEESPVAIPALYAETPSSLNSSFLKWDALTAGLIRSSAIPMCSKRSGELYVQTGVGRFSECGGKVLWSAVCCAASDGDDSFSVGLVKEGDMSRMSIKELEKLIGVTGLFSGGCGKDGDLKENFMSLNKEQLNSKTPSSDVQSEKHLAKRNILETEMSDSENEEVTSQHIISEDQSYTSSLESEVDLQESTNETNKESNILKILSITIKLLYAAFSPIVHQANNFPFQVAYVLQEDLAVLAAVPGDSVTLVNNLCSGVSSGVSCVFNIIYKTGEITTCTIYSCVSPLVSSLLMVFQELFVGMGMLVCDVLGIMTGIASNGFKISRVVLGSIWDQMVDCLYALCSEMGQQVSNVGCGIGKLTQKSGRGVGHLLKFVIYIVWGVVENTIVNVQEALTESWGESSIAQLPEVPTPEVTGE